MTFVFSRKDSPAVQRRSSSAVTQSARQSVSYRNSLPVSLSSAKSHKSLERKRASDGGLKKYSGSHSTSSIPRKVIKENAEKLKAIRKVSDDSNSGDEDDNFGPVTSILSFVDQPPGHGGRGPEDAWRQSLIHGVEEHEVNIENSNCRESRDKGNNEKAPVPGKNESVRKPVIKKKDESKASNKSVGTQPKPTKSTSKPIIKPSPVSPPSAKPSGSSAKSSPASSASSAAQKSKKKPLQQSVTAPLSERPGARHQLRATKSNTVPVTGMASKRSPGDLGTPRPASAASVSSSSAGRPVRGGGSQKSAEQVNTLPRTGTQSKNIKAHSKASQYPKKVSSEYPSEIVFKNQEGLKFSSVSFFDEDAEKGQSRYSHFLNRQTFKGSIPDDRVLRCARGCWATLAPASSPPPGQRGRGTRAR